MKARFLAMLCKVGLHHWTVFASRVLPFAVLELKMACDRCQATTILRDDGLGL